jgi:phosphatidylinositol glycan class W
MLPLILIFTIWSRNLLAVIVVSVIMLASLHYVLFIISRNSRKSKLSSFDSEPADDDTTIRPDILAIIINVYHYNVYLCTSICILAVDFDVFPRYFGKTHSYGQSIMDLGVGFFVICHSFKSVRRFMVNDKTTVQAKHLLSGYMSRGLALTVLGVVRLLITVIKEKNMDNAYGKHWNFFFTLAVMQVTSSKLFSVVLAVGFFRFCSRFQVCGLSISNVHKRLVEKGFNCHCWCCGLLLLPFVFQKLQPLHFER